MRKLELLQKQRHKKWILHEQNYHLRMTAHWLWECAGECQYIELTPRPPDCRKVRFYWCCQWFRPRIGWFHPILQIVLLQNSGKEFNQFCPPSSNDDLCLLFCINPSSMIVLLGYLSWFMFGAWCSLHGLNYSTWFSFSTFLSFNCHRFDITSRLWLLVYSIQYLWLSA